jgi:putative intracellular protease/amidase
MDQPLASKTVAILVANGFEETEMTEPQRALLAAGAAVRLVSPEQGLVNGWHGQAWGHYFPVDIPLAAALAADFDALLLPGGRRSIEKLAGNPHTLRILRGFVDGGKPIAALGHAPLLLAAAERAAGRTLGGEPEILEPLAAAGAVTDSGAAVVDGKILTAPSGGDVKQAVLNHFVTGLGVLADAA